ncbi:hypothetical protein [Megasphaera massiliensis]|uniref:hypothetical protein n=1 Tax=Megasphaera massiliensis TaxID=1232428 RepID=UPI0012B61747|nr:hypothetical protein [Megasphaera massiliensis]MBS6256053.1 hypothetical protein [Megasphaera sp.]
MKKNGTGIGEGCLVPFLMMGVMLWESDDGLCRLCQGGHEPANFQPNWGSG